MRVRLRAGLGACETLERTQHHGHPTPRKPAAGPRPAEGCGALGAGRARWRGTLGRGLWPSKCVFHMPSRLLSVTSSSSTWRRRPRGAAAAAPSAGVSMSPHPDFLAPPTGTLCHHAASACQRAVLGMAAPGTCDAPIPRPHSPAPAGAEGRELSPFAASRHRSRSTPWLVGKRAQSEAQGGQHGLIHSPEKRIFSEYRAHLAGGRSTLSGARDQTADRRAMARDARRIVLVRGGGAWWDQPPRLTIWFSVSIPQPTDKPSRVQRA